MKRGKKMYNIGYFPYSYPRKSNIFSNFRRMNFSTILDGTQKTLSIINQAIPVIYQVRPLYQNIKTAFKVVNALKDDTKDKERKKENSENHTNFSNGPTYFL